MIIKKLAVLIMVGILVVGCGSGHEYTDYAQSIDSSNQAGQDVLVAYFNKKAIDNENIFKAMTSDSKDPAAQSNAQMAIVLYTILSQQNDEKILRYFTPKYAEAPTTNADIGKSLADNFLPTLVKWGAGAWLGGKVVDGLSTTTYALGAGASMSSQQAGQDITGGATMSTNAVEGTSAQYENSFNAEGEASQGAAPTASSSQDNSVNTDQSTVIPETADE